MANPKIIGTFTLESSENFDEFLKALGVGLVTRKLATNTSSTMTFSYADGVYTMKTSSAVKSFEISFKPGETVDEATQDGRQCKTTFTLSGDVLTQVQKAAKGKDATFIREFTDTQIITTSECDGVKCVRKYKRT